MKQRIKVFINRLNERLWFRPFIFCLLSIGVALFANLADGTGLKEVVPNINTESLEVLLVTISSSMLVISIFAVASMLSAFSAASNTATPRSIKLIIVDDVSQYALSVFIGAFIFSIVALVALKNGYYQEAGHFILFLITVLIFGIVILTFLRWVDRISRLGQLENTIKKIEVAATKAMFGHIQNPHLNGVAIKDKKQEGIPIYADVIGYVQLINMEELQAIAESFGGIIRLNCIIGSFVYPNLPIAYISKSSIETDMGQLRSKIESAFSIGDNRFFDQDPRYGLIALSEIASRALSPGINDPGTAIQIIGSHIRLFYLWNNSTNKNDNKESVKYNLVEVPTILMSELFDDAFNPIATYASGNLEVMLQLQKAFCALASINHFEMQKAAILHSQKAFKRSSLTMDFADDLELLKKECLFSKK